MTSNSGFVRGDMVTGLARAARQDGKFCLPNSLTAVCSLTLAVPIIGLEVDEKMVWSKGSTGSKAMVRIGPLDGAHNLRNGC